MTNTPQQVTRTYTLHKNDAGVYYIEFNYDKQDAGLYGLTFDDMEFNLRVDVVAQSPTPVDVPISGAKTLTGGGKTTADIAENQFGFTVTADTDNPANGVTGVPSGTVYAQAATGALDFGTWTFSKAGSYSFTVAENAVADGYTKAGDVIVTVDVTLKATTNELESEVTYSSGSSLTFANTYTPDIPPLPTTTPLTVTKLWAGDANPLQPTGIEVHLYKDGKLYDTVTLSAANLWTYTWSDLANGYTWTVDEASVPDGYTKNVSNIGTHWTITNTYDFMLNTKDHFAYIIGYPDGTVQPEDDITRAEVTAIFFRMLTDETREKYWSTTNSFSDVKTGDWCNNGISTVAKTGVINGYPDGTFRPSGCITRAELVKIAVSFFKFTGHPSIASQFSDIEGHWAENYINFAYELGLVDGYPDGSFAPDKYVTRCEAMKIINHVLNRAPEKEHLLSSMIAWPDNANKNAWYYAEVQEATNSHEYSWTNYNGKVIEQWTELLPVRDWAAFEKEWSDAHSAPNPGEVVNGD